MWWNEASAAQLKNPTALCGLFRRRELLVPTWRFWLAGFALVLALLVFFFFEAEPFLSLTAPKPGGMLVVEGWAPDYALRVAVAQCSQAHYQKVFVTGGPLDQGAPLVEYKTAAELGVACLRKLGMPENMLQAVPAPWVRRDRTYESALTLKEWLTEHGVTKGTVTVLTVGPHARRSRLLFEKGLGRNFAVGVIAVAPDDFDPRHWWHSSAGVRTVISESIAYLYARFWFTGDEG